MYRRTLTCGISSSVGVSAPFPFRDALSQKLWHKIDLRLLLLASRFLASSSSSLVFEIDDKN